jgi:hypothetical protein
LSLCRNASVSAAWSTTGGAGGPPTTPLDDDKELEEELELLVAPLPLVDARSPSSLGRLFLCALPAGPTTSEERFDGLELRSAQHETQAGK